MIETMMEIETRICRWCNVMFPVEKNKVGRPAEYCCQLHQRMQAQYEYMTREKKNAGAGDYQKYGRKRKEAGARKKGSNAKGASAGAKRKK